MTLQNLPYIQSYPQLVMTQNGSPALSGLTALDAAGEYEAWVGPAYEDMVVSHIGVRWSTCTGSPTAEIRIETVDPATGLPTGTLWATDTNIVTGTLVSGTFPQHALTAPATIPRGSLYAIVIKYNSGTLCTTVNFGGGSSGGITRALPCRVVNTGTPTRSNAGGITWLCITIGSSATEFYRSPPGILPANAVVHTAFNNASAAKRGARFQVPKKCRIIGIRHFMAAQTGAYNALAMDDAGTDLGGTSKAYDGRTQHSNGGSIESLFAAPAILLPATWYRVAIEPTSVTNCGIMTIGMATADHKKAMPGGMNFHHATFGSGIWTEDDVNVPLMDLLIDQDDDGRAPRAQSLMGI